MSDAINKKSNIQSDAESQIEINPERVPYGLVPKVYWNAHWKEYNEEKEPHGV